MHSNTSSYKKQDQNSTGNKEASSPNNDNDQESRSGQQFIDLCKNGELGKLKALSPSCIASIKDNPKVIGSALYSACSEEHFEVAQWMLDNFEAQIRECPLEIELALQMACRYGHFNVAQSLLKKFATQIKGDIDAIGNVLCEGCINGHFNIVQLLIEKYEEQIKKCPFKIQQVFSGACSRGHFNVVQLLIEKFEAKIGENPWQIQQAFKGACSRRHFNVVQLLLDKFEAQIGENPWQIQQEFKGACFGGNLLLAKLLLEKFAAQIKKDNGFIEGVFKGTRLRERLVIITGLAKVWQDQGYDVEITKEMAKRCLERHEKVLKELGQPLSPDQFSSLQELQAVYIQMNDDLRIRKAIVGEVVGELSVFDSEGFEALEKTLSHIDKVLNALGKCEISTLCDMLKTEYKQKGTPVTFHIVSVYMEIHQFTLDKARKGGDLTPSEMKLARLTSLDDVLEGIENDNLNVASPYRSNLAPEQIMKQDAEEQVSSYSDISPISRLQYLKMANQLPTSHGVIIPGMRSPGVVL